MSLPYNNRQLDHARALRKNMTAEERHLWYDFLKSYPVKIYKQKIIGSYIVDFYCEQARLVIELDGSQHYDDTGLEKDRLRTEYLEGLGLKVIRFSNTQIKREFQGVCEALDLLIAQRRKSRLSVTTI